MLPHDQPMHGAPTQAHVPGLGVVPVRHSPRIRKEAEEYTRSIGLPYHPPTHYVKVDPERAKKIAEAYDKMPHAPNDPETREAYEAMAKETVAQYDHLLKSGFKAHYIRGEDPYKASPRLAIHDIQHNNHMHVFPTLSGFGSDAKFDARDNPLLGDSGRTIGGEPATYNDIFRVVHDYFGHAKEGNGMRADGEENAWRSHAAMYTPKARRAMTTETRGQNSWVNFGRHAAHNVKAKGDTTIYADQKVGLLPDWVVNGDSPVSLARQDQTNLRAEVLRTLATKAGYKLGHVTPLENGRVAAELHHDGDLDTSNLVAAWYGLLAKEPRVLAFHEHNDGPDTLHTWVTSARRENVAHAAKGIGIQHFHMSPTGRVYSWDRGKANTAKLLTFARNTRAQDHQAFVGTGQLLGAGSGPDSAGRSSYRNTIEGYSNTDA